MLKVLQMGEPLLKGTYESIDVTQLKPGLENYVMIPRNPLTFANVRRKLDELEIITNFVLNDSGHLNVNLWSPELNKKLCCGISFRYEDCLFQLDKVQSMLRWFGAKGLYENEIQFNTRIHLNHYDCPVMRHWSYA